MGGETEDVLKVKTFFLVLCSEICLVHAVLE
jgi:hypothetical protein